MKRLVCAMAMLLIPWPGVTQTTSAERPRAREAGVIVGTLPTGAHNAITDVAGVRVGHATVRSGTSINTGVTAVLPPGDDWFRERVPAAIVVGNGFGKLLGVTQVRELGELETPILLTCTLCVWKAADAMVEWLLHRPGMDGVRSINPVVGETNDGGLNDIRARPIAPADVVAALERARGGAVEEGAVGAGTGTRAFGWKGGIGTSSRVLPDSQGGYTVGVLVQSNFGGSLTISGAPVGRELAGERGADPVLPGAGMPASTDAGMHVSEDGKTSARQNGSMPASEDGSIMMVVATDAPLDSRNLERLARRALVGLARTGSSMSNGSGDYVIAFSTAGTARRRDSDGPRDIADLPNDSMSSLFRAVADATEESIYNSLFKAVTVQGARSTAEALPLDRVLEILRRYNALGRASH